MRMRSAGGMMDGLMKMANIEIQYDYQDQGKETIELEAGKFNARKISGTGSVQSKIMFKKMNIESTNTMWISNKVPFGTIKMEGESIVNGKNKTTTASKMLEYGMTGANSEITGEIQDAPQMPELGNIFGNN